MTDLDDGFDEVLTLPPQLLMNPAKEYQHDILHIKRRYQYDTIAIYTSPEFRMLRQRLQRIVGEMEANNIMNDNI